MASKKLVQIREIPPDLRSEDLVKKLKDLFNQLRESKCGDDNTTISRSLADHLAQDGFFQHPDKHVRAYIAACLAEMFRIFVGTTEEEASQASPIHFGPLSDVATLKSVFEFLIEQMRQVLIRSSPFVSLGVSIIQTMASTKAFTLLFNIEDHQKMLEEVFETFFSVVSEKHTAVDRAAFLDIMTSLVDDADMVITHSLLEILLHPFSRDAKRQNPSALLLAKDLLSRIPKDVEPGISSYFGHIMIFDSSESGDMRDSMSEIILELFNVSPQLVSSALRHLDQRVGSGMVKERVESLILFGLLFGSDKFPEASTADKELLVKFATQRLTDIDEKVRVQAVKVASAFICSRKSDEEKAIIKDYLKNVAGRFVDLSGHVRAEVVRAVADIMVNALEFVPEEIITEFGERLLDKDQLVRNTCINCTLDIFSKYLYGTKLHSSSFDMVRSKMGPLMKRFLDVIMDLPERNTVEYKFQFKLLPSSANDQTLANNIIYFYACAGEKGMSFFEETIEKNTRARNCFLAAIDEQLDPTLQARNRRELTLTLPELGKYQEGLDKIFSLLIGEGIDRQFRGLVKNYVALTTANYSSSLDELLKRFGNPSETNSTYQAGRRLLELLIPFRLTTRLCQVIYNTAVDVLNDHISGAEFLCQSIAVKVQPEVLRQRSARLLQFISRHVPAAFATRIDLNRMVRFWRDRDSQVALCVCQFFANCGKDIKLERNNKVIIEQLLEKTHEFAGHSQNIVTPVEGKYSVKCINGLAVNRLELFRSLLGWIKETVEADDKDDLHYLAAIAAVGEMAVCTGHNAKPVDDDTIVVTEKDAEDMTQLQKELISFMTEDLLPKLHFKNVDNAECEEEGPWIPREDLPSGVLFLLYSMKALGKFFRAYLPFLDTVASIEYLRRFTRKLEDCITDSGVEGISQEHLVMCAGIQLLKLCPVLESAKDHLFDLASLYAVIPQLSHIDSRFPFVKKLYKFGVRVNGPGRILVAVSAAAQSPEVGADDGKPFREIVIKPLTEVVRHLRKRVVANAEKYRLMLPDLSVLYLIHTLVFSKEFKDPENLEHCLKWLEKQGSSLYCLLDVIVTENEKFSPGILHKLLQLAKSSHVVTGSRKTRKADQKLYVLCDFAIALLEKRFPQFAKQENPLRLDLPSEILKTDTELQSKEPRLHFKLPVSVTRRGDGSAAVYIGSHDRSESRDSDGVKNGRTRTKRSRSALGQPQETEPEPEEMEVS